jgi:hypothetical protein
VGTGPPAVGLSVVVPAGTPTGVVEVPPALEEEEAGLLQFEVSSTLSCMPSVSRGSCSPLPFFHCQGVAGRPRPCAYQCAEVKDVPDDGAVLEEGTTGGGERGGAGRAITHHNRDREAAAGRDDGGGLTGIGASRPLPRARAGSLRGSVRQGPRDSEGPC